MRPVRQGGFDLGFGYVLGLRDEGVIAGDTTTVHSLLPSVFTLVVGGDGTTLR